MTNITEVSATEYPYGISTYMCWTPDRDHLQHRIVPGVSRDLGMGTELSFVALNNQVRNVIWYGGEAFPVLDIHWIAKQYYHELLNYAKLPATQESFDKYFKTHFNMCDERMRDYAFVSVEDDRNNAFETKRNFATIAEKQGFINIISREYMLREYMTENTELFNTDPKAIPYFTADYARTKRNVILTICLNLCVTGIKEKDLQRELLLIGIDSNDPSKDLWKEISLLFCNANNTVTDKNGNKIITITDKNSNKELFFEKDITLNYVRKYSIDSGKFENIYSIEDKQFANVILDDLRSAEYIAEKPDKDNYIGTELKGHIYQRYLPGQFFTLNGKYYEMVSVTGDNRILMRRASEHVSGRLSYRQVRRYCIDRIENSELMGDLKTINGIDIYHQFADFRVQTPAYWKMNAYNDFPNGKLIEINGVPERRYFNKQILKMDFSRLGDVFTDRIRITLTVMLNEVFVTLFADNQPFISAITPGNHSLPQTYSLEFGEDVLSSSKSIYIIEDSQLDIGLLVTVERNINRFLQIISDYLSWNEEMMEKRCDSSTESVIIKKETLSEAVLKLMGEKKNGFFSRAWTWFRSLFNKKSKKISDEQNKEDERNSKVLIKEEHKKAKALSKKEKKKTKKQAKEEIIKQTINTNNPPEDISLEKESQKDSEDNSNPSNDSSFEIISEGTTSKQETIPENEDFPVVSTNKSELSEKDVKDTEKESLSNLVDLTIHDIENDYLDIKEGEQTKKEEEFNDHEK
jgi:hypothetical protein